LLTLRVGTIDHEGEIADAISSHYYSMSSFVMKEYYLGLL